MGGHRAPRSISLLFTAGLLLALAGCGGEETSSPEKPEPASSAYEETFDAGPVRFTLRLDVQIAGFELDGSKQQVVHDLHRLLAEILALGHLLDDAVLQ